MRYIVLLFVLMHSFLFAAKPKEKRSPPGRFLPAQSFVILPDKTGPLAEHYARIKYADALCAKEVIKFEKKVSGKAELLVERPVVLAAFDPVNGSWHMVHVAVPNPIPESYFRELRKGRTIAERNACKIPVRTITPGYSVEHVIGAGPTRLTVRLRYSRSGAKELTDVLTVYRMVYPRIPGKKETNYARATAKAQFLYYTPGNDELFSQAFVKEGERFLRLKIHAAQEELRRLGVHSHAFPEKLLADVFPDEIPLSLMVSEQWDPLFFLEDQKGSLKRILAEYGINREEAFMWSVSSANAVGTLQFTNKNNNGTYAAVVRAYREAGLVSSFEDGSRNMHNVIKAALCLLDLELARSKKGIELFAQDPVLGGILPTAAYNGGPLAAERMIAEIERLNGKKLPLIDRAIMKLPNVLLPPSYRSEKSRKSKVVQKGIRGNSETPMYGRKYLFLMDYWGLKKK
jgi:hypothetical protein